MLQQRSQRLLSAFYTLSARAPSPSLACIAAQRCRRAYSAQPKLAELDPAKLSVTKTTTPKDLLPPEELVFGRTFTGTCFFLLPAPPYQNSRTIRYQATILTYDSHQTTCSLSNGPLPKAG